MGHKNTLLLWIVPNQTIQSECEIYLIISPNRIIISQPYIFYEYLFLFVHFLFSL